MSSALIAPTYEPIDRVPRDRAPTTTHDLQQASTPWKGRARVSVVIPALNEADCLPHVLPRLPAWVDEVLLVDGQSTDGTVDIARRLRPDVRIVAQQGRGKGAALRTGL